jgi:hypothetical protein
MNEHPSARELRKEILLARVALQRVELGRSVSTLRESLRLPAVIGSAFQAGGRTGTVLSALAGLARRFPVASTLTALVAKRVPRLRTLVKWIGVTMAIWPLISFVREQARDRRRGQ